MRAHEMQGRRHQSGASDFSHSWGDAAGTDDLWSSFFLPVRGNEAWASGGFGNRPRLAF